MLKTMAVTVALAATAPAALAAPGIDESPTVLTLVEVKKPWYASSSLVASRMRKTVPTYQALDGLREKTFTIAQDGKTFGGLYRWRTRGDAEAWFNEAWRTRIQKQYGAPARVTWFSSSLAIDGAAAGAPLTKKAVAYVVRVPTPAGVTEERLRAGFVQSVPTYQAAPGLVRKWFLITEDARFGGVYLWTDDAAAQAWFNTAWRERIRKTYGADAEITRFSAPITLRND